MLRVCLRVVIAALEIRFVLFVGALSDFAELGCDFATLNLLLAFLRRRIAGSVSVGHELRFSILLNDAAYL